MTTNGFALPRMVVALREGKGMSQSKLAKVLGVSPSAVNQVERSDHGLQESVFLRYAKAIGYGDEIGALEAGLAALSKVPIETREDPLKPKRKAKPPRKR